MDLCQGSYPENSKTTLKVTFPIDFNIRFQIIMACPRACSAALAQRHVQTPLHLPGFSLLVNGVYFLEIIKKPPICNGNSSIMDPTAKLDMLLCMNGPLSGSVQSVHVHYGVEIAVAHRCNLLKLFLIFCIIPKTHVCFAASSYYTTYIVCGYV